MPLRLLTLFLAAFALMLGGCTRAVWSDFAHPVNTHKDLGEERLTSLRVTQQAAGGIPAGTLILIGEKNWYIADADHAEGIVAYLTAGLDTSFYPVYKDIDVSIFRDSQGRRTFYLPLTLDFRPSEADLVRLADKGLATNGKYRLVRLADKGLATNGNYRIEGTLFGTYHPAPTASPDTGALPLDVTLHLEYLSSRPNLPGLAVALFATPVTLLTDVVAHATVIPLAKAILPKGRF